MEDAPFYKRVTLLVADIDRSFTIYRDILEFTVDWINDSSKESNQERTLGFTEVKGLVLTRSGIPYMSTRVIKVNNIKSAMIKLLQWA